MDFVDDLRALKAALLGRSRERCLHAIGSTKISETVRVVLVRLEDSYGQCQQVSGVALAEEVGLRDYSLSRLLNRDLGCGLWDLRPVLRARAALCDLIRAVRPIEQVAHHGGYREQAQFTRDVSALLGLSPARFRHVAWMLGAGPEIQTRRICKTAQATAQFQSLQDD